LSAETLLRVEHLRAGYGSDAILDDVSIALAAGEAVTVLGPNGAGKTTLLRAISGVISPRAGAISLRGKPIARRPAHAVSRGGIGHVPEGRGIFPGLSVAENLALGRFAAADRRSADAARAQVIELFPWLPERMKQLAGTLSGGEQQMLAIGRALMGEPSVLLLDEPSLGLSPLMVEHVFNALEEIRARDVAILVVEQNLHHALSLASRGYVMNRGQIVLEGSVDVLNDSDVFGAYLTVS
jgi:branched-chain amino acid transport system ATP-binding protein